MNPDAVISALAGNVVARFVYEYGWVWPLCETLHFIGLAVMLGAIGLFDLRVLGVGRDLPLAELHRYLRWGIAAFIVNALTGVVFFATFPAQYVYNAAFQLKFVALLLLGLNVAVFYAFAWPRLRKLEASMAAPWSARCSAALSLVLLVTVPSWLLTTTRYCAPSSLATACLV